MNVSSASKKRPVVDYPLEPVAVKLVEGSA
jgi:hypothetical protein